MAYAHGADGPSLQVGFSGPPAAAQADGVDVCFAVVPARRGTDVGQTSPARPRDDAEATAARIAAAPDASNGVLFAGRWGAGDPAAKVLQTGPLTNLAVAEVDVVVWGVDQHNTASAPQLLEKVPVPPRPVPVLASAHVARQPQGCDFQCVVDVAPAVLRCCVAPHVRALPELTTEQVLERAKLVEPCTVSVTSLPSRPNAFSVRDLTPAGGAQTAYVAMEDPATGAAVGEVMKLPFFLFPTQPAITATVTLVESGAVHFDVHAPLATEFRYALNPAAQAWPPERLALPIGTRVTVHSTVANTAEAAHEGRTGVVCSSKEMGARHKGLLALAAERKLDEHAAVVNVRFDDNAVAAVPLQCLRELPSVAGDWVEGWEVECTHSARPELAGKPGFIVSTDGDDAVVSFPEIRERCRVRVAALTTPSRDPATAAVVEATARDAMVAGALSTEGGVQRYVVSLAGGAWEQGEEYVLRLVPVAPIPPPAHDEASPRRGVAAETDFVMGKRVELRFTAPVGMEGVLQKVAIDVTSSTAADVVYQSDAPGGVLHYAVRPAVEGDGTRSADEKNAEAEALKQALLAASNGTTPELLSKYTAYGSAGMMPGGHAVPVRGLEPGTDYTVVALPASEQAGVPDGSAVQIDFKTRRAPPKITSIEMHEVTSTTATVQLGLNRAGAVRYYVVPASFQTTERNVKETEAALEETALVFSTHRVTDHDDRWADPDPVVSNLLINHLPTGAELDLYTWAVNDTRTEAADPFAPEPLITKNRIRTVDMPNIEGTVQLSEVTHEDATFTFRSTQPGRVVWCITGPGLLPTAEDIHAAGTPQFKLQDEFILASGSEVVDTLYLNHFKSTKLSPETSYTLHCLSVPPTGQLPAPVPQVTRIDFTTKEPPTPRIERVVPIHVGHGKVEVLVTPQRGHAGGNIRYLIRPAKEMPPTRAEMLERGLTLPLRAPDTTIKFEELAQGTEYSVYVAPQGAEADIERVDVRMQQHAPKVLKATCEGTEDGVILRVVTKGPAGRLHWAAREHNPQASTLPVRDLLIGKGFEQTGMHVQTEKWSTEGLEGTEVEICGIAGGRRVLNGKAGVVVPSDMANEDVALVDIGGGDGVVSVALDNLRPVDPDTLDVVTSKVLVKNLPAQRYYDFYVCAAAPDGADVSRNVTHAVGASLVAPPKIVSSRQVRGSTASGTLGTVLSGMGRVYVAAIPEGVDVPTREAFLRQIELQKAGIDREESDRVRKATEKAQAQQEMLKPGSGKTALLLALPTATTGDGRPVLPTEVAALPVCGYAVARVEVGQDSVFPHGWELELDLPPEAAKEAAKEYVFRTRNFTGVLLPASFDNIIQKENFGQAVTAVPLTVDDAPPTLTALKQLNSTTDGCVLNATVESEAHGLLYWAVQKKDSPKTARLPTLDIIARADAGTAYGDVVCGDVATFAPGRTQIDVDLIARRLAPNTDYTAYALVRSDKAAKNGVMPETETKTVEFRTSKRHVLPIQDVVVAPKIFSVEVKVAPAVAIAEGRVAVRVMKNNTPVGKPRILTVRQGEGAVAVDGLEPNTSQHLQVVPLSPDDADDPALVEWDTAPVQQVVPFRTLPEDKVMSRAKVVGIKPTEAQAEFLFNKPGHAQYLIRAGEPKSASLEDVTAWGKQISAKAGGTECVPLTALKPGHKYTLLAVGDGCDELIVEPFATPDLPPVQHVAGALQLGVPKDGRVQANYTPSAAGKLMWLAVPAGSVEGVPEKDEFRDMVRFVQEPQAGGTEEGLEAGKKGVFPIPLVGMTTSKNYDVYTATVDEYGRMSEPRKESATFKTEDFVKNLPSIVEDVKDKSETVVDDFKPRASGNTFAEEEKNPQDHQLDLGKVEGVEYLKALFKVTKYNPEQPFSTGGKERVWLLDFFARAFSNLKEGTNVKALLKQAEDPDTKSFPYSSLFRCEKDTENARRLRLRFFRADHPYDLLFESAANRQRFYECAKALKNALVWAPDLCPRIQGAHCFNTTIKGSAQKKATLGSSTERQFLQGNVKIKCANVPTDQMRLWVGCIDLQNVALPKEVNFDRWLPRGECDVYVVGFLDLPQEYQGNTKLGDRMAAYLGSEYVALISTEREAGKRSIALMILMTNQRVSKVSNTGAWTGQFTRKQKNAMGVGKALAHSVTDAAALSFSLNETPLCFVCTKLSPLPEEEDEPMIRNEIMKDVLDSVSVGLPTVDTSVRFHHLFMVGSFAYGFDGDEDDVPAWDRLSALPPGSDMLQQQIDEKAVCEGFVEGDLEMVEEFREFSLEQRVLSRSYPGLELNSVSYQAFNIGSGRHAVSSQYAFESQLVYLQMFSNPQPKQLVLQIDSCVLTCKVRKRKAEKKSKAKAADDVDLGDELDVGGKPGLLQPYVTVFADFAEGAYRSSTMSMDPNTGLQTTNKFVPILPTSCSKAFLERQYLLFSVKNHATVKDNAKLKPEEAMRDNFYASAVLPIRDLIHASDGKMSFCVPLSSGGAPAKATLTGLVRIFEKGKEDASADAASKAPRPKSPKVLMGSSTERQIEVTYENERKTLTKGFDAANLMSRDFPHWSNEAGTKPRSKTNYPLPQGWVWEDEWKPLREKGVTDDDGWAYADTFKADQDWAAKKKMGHNVRQRKWMRTRVVSHKATTAT
eukprot:TRINITY_DN7109_c0_g1_i1.p1 TRINITY_DN7109_c0_g1~~TRINITY_DN7109_c0_g1_i1.p1  ORF type:complete len:2769 (+),score=1024.11 TRINITY_DN7109_c0_g1_i1:431-8308(+)